MGRMGRMGPMTALGLLMGFAVVCWAEAADPGEKAAAALAHRLLGDRAGEFQFATIPREGDLDVFEIDYSQGTVTLRGSSPVTMASALYWYLKYHCRCHVSWCGDQLALPNPLPFIAATRRVSPYRYRYNFNYVTFSYTMAWWDWRRWEREIDWMALHGINMPLAITGQEAIWQAVFRKLGLSDAEIGKFFVGPGYLPFGWMGCMDGWGGPLPQSWIDRHAELGKKILARERELGMTPVLQGFTGHVPEALKAKFPQAKLQRLPSWCGFPGTWFIDPTDPLFREIGKAFVEEQTRQFGTDHLYASDTFIEMSPPSNDPAFLANMGKAVYEAMTVADPQAVWVMQGWIFCNNPNFWKPPQAKALLESVPKGRMLVLDLFCDASPTWKQTEAFHGQPWIWCVIHNFGGTTGLYGRLATLARDLPETLNDPKRGGLCGIGLAMEGFEHNPIYYELATEMAWHSKPVDLDAWVRDYVRARYGGEFPKAEQAWKILLDTAYSAGMVDSVICARPSLSARGSAVPYPPEKLMEAWQGLQAAGVHPPVAQGQQFSDTFRYDLVNTGRQVLANLAGQLHSGALAAYQAKDRDRLKQAGTRFLTLIDDLDGLVRTRKEFRLAAWLRDARDWGADTKEKAAFEWNARNLVTLWGPRESGLHDYSHRQWAGLLKGFYRPRWEMFFQRLGESLETGNAFDSAGFQRDLTLWEESWTRQESNDTGANWVGEAFCESFFSLRKYRPILAEAYKPEAVSLTTGKPVSCSAALPNNPASLANDGRRSDPHRHWATDSRKEEPAWWQVDLEKPTTVGRIIVVPFFGDRRFYGFTVELSNDGQAWDTVAGRRENKEPATAEGYTCAFPPRATRFIRVTITHCSANTGRHLVEVLAVEK